MFAPRELVGQEPTMNIMFPVLLRYSDVGLLPLRLMVAVVLFTSGLGHLKDPVGRSKSIGASPAFAAFLGSGEVLGSIGVAFGILIQLAAIGLMLIMLGAIQKKIFVWKSGFWVERRYAWHYHPILLLINLVIVPPRGVPTPLL